MGRIRPCPKPFFFKTRKGGREGGIVHAERLIEYLELERRDYYKVVQLLEWKNDGWSIRFGYYLRPHGSNNRQWTWGSQTTSVISIEHLDDIIEALRKMKGYYEEKERQ